jgi:hypothetical protein
LAKLKAQIMRHIALFLTLIILAACAPAQSGGVTIIPTQVSLQGNVNITYPISGSIIYAEALFLQGTASNIPAEGFRIQIIAPDDTILAETIVQADDDTWQLELVHEYSGEPIEAIIIARSLDNAVPEDYDIESIIISSSEYRPEGVFGAIIAPAPNSTVGGDQIPIIGRGSGFFEGTFILALEEADDGTEISQVVVTMFNPYFIDDMIWEVDLPTNGFTGHAVLRMFYQSAATGEEIDIERVELVISSVAG